MELLRVDNIGIGYGRGDVLREASLSVGASDFIGVIGPNGGGKTTFIKGLLGLIPLSSGTITRRQGLTIGYMPQHRTVDTAFPISVAEVILTGLKSKGLKLRGREEHRLYLQELLALTGLEDVASDQIGELSGGQLQRVLLCRSIISRPELLILDEPTTYVDSRFEHNFYELLRQLNERMAIVLVSHDLGTICSHVRSIACINGTLHYHPNAELTPEILSHYDCPIRIVDHGKVAHTILPKH